ncbi:HlyD family secretion protein [Faecalibacter sp. LW9]|uniref:HlyD family secretion protein n=1 Tax=Faecalibacter sp. LW9 TaxID=3103144 RepID=UPI002AFE8B1E|nr:biotin/lipoyl-binding protein [Faecalibacter sp. LW9]
MKNTLYYIFALSGLILFTNCKSTDKENKKEEQTVFQGKIERDQISVVTKIPGKIDQILVNEGDEVKKGQTLFILQLPEVDAKKSQAKGAVNSAEAQYEMAKKGATDNQLKQLRAKVAGLKEQLDYAEKSNHRLKNMLRDSLVPQQNYDEIYAKYQGAKNQYLAAKAELADAENGARVEQQRMALGQKERALGALQEVDVAEAERFIKAPQDMTVETINLKVGELALAGYSIANGILEETTFFRFTIPENKIGQLQKNQIVNLKVPYKNNMVLKGKIVSIKVLNSYANISTAYPDIDQQQSQYEVKVVPVDYKQAAQLLTKANVVLDLNAK